MTANWTEATNMSGLDLRVLLLQIIRSQSGTSSLNRNTARGMEASAAELFDS